MKSDVVYFGWEPSTIGVFEGCRFIVDVEASFVLFPIHFGVNLKIDRASIFLHGSYIYPRHYSVNMF